MRKKSSGRGSKLSPVGLPGFQIPGDSPGRFRSKSPKTDVIPGASGAPSINPSEDKSETLPVADEDAIENNLQERYIFLTSLINVACQGREIAPLIEEYARQIVDFTNCASVRLFLLDSDDKLHKASGGTSPGLWELDGQLIKGKLDSLFAVDSGVPRGYMTPKGSIYLLDVSSIPIDAPDYLKEIAQDTFVPNGFRSVLLIPLKIDNRLAGLIQVADNIEGGISVEMIEVLESAAAILTVAIHEIVLLREFEKQRAGLLRQLYERGAALVALNEKLRRELEAAEEVRRKICLQRDMAVALAGADNLKETLEACLDTGLRISGMDSGAIYLVDEKRGALRLACCKGLSPDFEEHIRQYGMDSQNMRLVMSGLPVYRIDQWFNGDMDEKRQAEGLKSGAIVPIKCEDHEGKVIGSLNIFSYVYDAIPSDARNALETIAAQVGSVISKVRDRELLCSLEKRYRGILDEIHDAYFELDLEGNFTFANAATCHILGYAREEFAGVNYRAVIVIDDIQLVSRVFSEIYDSSQSKSFTCRVICKDGSIKHLETRVSILKDEQGEVTGFSCLCHDVTRRDESEGRLPISEGKSTSVIENLPDVIWTTDMNLQLSYVSPAVRYLIGLSAREIMSMFEQGTAIPESLGIAEVDYERFKRALNAVRDNPLRIHSFEFEFRHKDGFRSWAEVKIGVMRDKAGQPSGILGIMRDISQQKKASKDNDLE